MSLKPKSYVETYTLSDEDDVYVRPLDEELNGAFNVRQRCVFVDNEKVALAFHVALADAAQQEPSTGVLENVW